MPVPSKPVLSFDDRQTCPDIAIYAQMYPARSGMESVQLSQHFQPASNRDRIESSQFSKATRDRRIPMTFEL